ncbi:enoyl-CoA hydratase/isomerase family protein [Labedaea rhizosphaerae]|uniref:Enoyl-CoA hydratase/carnithine racemase n=1 Tax=Labedaea rhizosphaerae TaxID=598644 RepID=A0A4V3D041_LABRH|nr:enoyl-CoA hydratase-related protein [Labedaea rhizosphaerae]TDQ04275.1 enoyl-CoA hydratase/carnithine racemase [Labedaea rhizosphaerae]
MTENLRVSVDGAVATVTIDRPDKRNALSFAMWSAFPEIAQDLAADPRVRVVVVTGGAHFSAGADISEFRSLRSDADGARRYQSAVHDAGRALALLGKPTIAAINGFCVGGGCEIALACDLRVAADDARFGITPAKLGIVFALPSTKQLVDAVGPAWAKQILFTGEILDASTALRIGLVNELHPADAVPARARALAEVIASRSQVSVRGAKTIVTRITDGLTDEDEVVHSLYEASVTSADYAEGVAAFLEKRAPVF